MKKIFTLTKVMVITSLQGMTTSKKKTSKSKNILTILGIVALYLYLATIIYFMSRDILKVFIMLNQQNLIINLVFLGSSLYALIIAILTIPSVFYFSKDVEILLAMPLKPKEILIAKTASTYFNLLIGLSFILLPFGIAYQAIVMPPFYFLIFYVIACLIVPIVPLAIAVVFVVLLFTFVPKVNNKDMFTYLTSFLMLGTIFFMNSLTIGNENFFQDFIAETSQLGQSITSFIPTVALLSSAVNSNNLLMMAIALILSLLFIYLVVKLFSHIYFKGAIGISESSKQAKSHKIKKVDFTKKIPSKTFSLIKTDLKNILRTPVFMINYILPLLILPVVFIFPAINAMTSEGFVWADLNGYRLEAQAFIKSVETLQMLAYVIIGSFSITFFMSALSSISATAISREGERMVFYKSLPISMMLLIRAKLIIGISLSLFMPIIILIVGIILLRPSIILIIAALLTIFIVAIFSNVFDIVFDVYKPKLVWDDETQAIKQNFVSIIPIFSSFLIIGFSLFVFFQLAKFQLLISILILIVLVALTYFLYSVVIEKNGLKKLDQAIETI